MAHKKAAGSTRNGRDSAGKRLGFRRSGGGRGTPVPFLYVSVAPPSNPAPKSAGANI